MIFQNFILFWLVGIGGGLGAMCRFAIARAVAKHPFFPQLPTIVATGAANLIGCFLAGFLVGVLQSFLIKKQILPTQYAEYYAFAITGFCGGLTTFSSLILELSRLQHAQFSWLAVAYLFFSLIIGIIFLILGEALGAYLGNQY